MSLALGYAHPDLLLKELDSRQIGEWMAFGQLEQVGHPIPPDPEEEKKKKAQQTRAKFEGGMTALMQKQKRGK